MGIVQGNSSKAATIPLQKYSRNDPMAATIPLQKTKVKAKGK